MLKLVKENRKASEKHSFSTGMANFQDSLIHMQVYKSKLRILGLHIYLDDYDFGVKIKCVHNNTGNNKKSTEKQYLYYHDSIFKCSESREGMHQLKYRLHACYRWNPLQLLPRVCHREPLPKVFKVGCICRESSPQGISNTLPNRVCPVLSNDIKTYHHRHTSSTALPVASKHTTNSRLKLLSSVASSALSIASIFLLIFMTYVPSTTLAEPLKVHIHAIIPSHFAMTTELNREFHNTMLNFRRDHRNQRFRSLFNPEGDMTFISDDSPREIMDAFCKGALSKHATTILNINNPLGIRRRTSSNKYILELASSLGIPLISWDSQFSGTSQSERHLQLAPTIEHQARAMVSLLERYNWTSFTIVTSQVAGDSQFVSAVNTIVEHSARKAKLTAGDNKKNSLEILSTIRIRHLSDIHTTLKKLVGTDTRVFLLHCSSRTSYEIIETAVGLGLTGKDYVWILTRSSIPTGKFGTDSFPVGLLGISFEYNLEAMKRAIRAGVKMWMYAMLDMFHRPAELVNRTLVPQFTCQSRGEPYWRDGDMLYRHLLNVSIRDEPFIEFNENGTLKTTEVIIVNLQWHDGTRDKTEWREVGRWVRHGLMMQDITWPGESSVPPTGKPKRAFLRVATLTELPYVIYRLPQDDGVCEDSAVPCQIYQRNRHKDVISNATVLRCCVGLSIDLLKILSTQLNFDYVVTEVEDATWGSINKVTKSWNGLVKVLLDDKADIVITAMKINPERAEAVRFSLPYLETGIKIIVALRGGAISPTAFLEPYDYASWSLILIFSVHATGSSILIFEWLSPYGLNRGNTAMREHKFSLFRSFWLIWSMLFSTSVPTNSPKGIASRFLANIWALFALVFLASYTANLAAFMITKEEFYDLSGIQDYRLQNPYTMNPPFKYATVPNGSTEANIRANHKDMFNYMKPYNQPDVEAGIAALKSGNIQAFIYDSSVLEYYASRDPQCRLVTVGNRYAMTGYGVAFQPDFQNPWIDKINRVILKLQENGELDRLQKFWLAGACKSKKETNLANRTLGILNFTSAFILLGSGVLLGLIILCFEHMYFLFWRKHLRELDKCGCCSLVSLSVGMSLQDEDEKVLYAKNRGRCKDPFCETQIWKLKHELDMALLRIDDLQNKLSDPDTQFLNMIPYKAAEHERVLQRDTHTPDFRGNVTGRPHINTLSCSRTDHTPKDSLESLRLNDKMDVHSENNSTNCKRLEKPSNNSDAANTSQPRNNSLDDYLPCPPLEDYAPVEAESDGAHCNMPVDSTDNCRCNTYIDFDGLSTGSGSESDGNILMNHKEHACQSPAHKLRRTPSYTSAIGSTMNFDLTRDSPTESGKMREFEGKRYSGVGNKNSIT